MQATPRWGMESMATPDGGDALSGYGTDGVLRMRMMPRHDMESTANLLCMRCPVGAWDRRRLPPDAGGVLL
jgi:hypothetical protein